MEKVNLFTVRRTEPVQEREIDWARDFPGVLNAECGEIELVRDRRPRPTENEKRIIRFDRERQFKAEVNAGLIGAAIGAGAVCFLFDVMFKIVGV